MSGFLKKSKSSKTVWLGIGVVLLLAVAAVVIVLTHQKQNIETVTVYYKSMDGSGFTGTKTAILDEKSAWKLQGCLNQLKYNDFVDSAVLPDVNEPPYEIQGEHTGSSHLDFNVSILGLNPSPFRRNL